MILHLLDRWWSILHNNVSSYGPNFVLKSTPEDRHLDSIAPLRLERQDVTIRFLNRFIIDFPAVAERNLANIRFTKSDLDFDGLTGNRPFRRKLYRLHISGRDFTRLDHLRHGTTAARSCCADTDFGRRRCLSRSLGL
ncbi:MAG TPA: hypothetical protein DCZ69_11955 [Syntrophobacteraceae bacterium]|nr:hypothetical protein [Syntrophobacteraceae bacterium]HBD08965.1 hypothetical protein [Syntrophobacteraceae bacterium]HBZ55193.1 hypothetical protein [Syntrophobacteraceae bacterium]